MADTSNANDSNSEPQSEPAAGGGGPTRETGTGARGTGAPNMDSGTGTQTGEPNT